MIDISTITTFAAPVGAFVAGIVGGARWINTNTDKIEKLEGGLNAVKTGADGILNLLIEVVAASKDNTLTADELAQIVKTASDIPGAIRTALRIASPVAPVSAPSAPVA